MTFLTRDGRSRLGSLDRACQPINIRRRRAASDIGAKQTARRILRNAEKSRVELGATVRRIPLAKWLLLTVRAEN